MNSTKPYSRSIRILLAENNLDHAELTSDALENDRIEVHLTLVTNGHQAIEHILRSPEDRPDLILLDIKMPVKSGFDVLQFLKEHAELKNIPVIMLSSTTNENEIQKAYNSGAHCFINKPLTSRQFLAIVETLKFAR